MPVEDTGGDGCGSATSPTCVEDHQPLIGDAVGRGGPGLLLVVEKFPGADTLEVTEASRRRSTSCAPGSAGIEIDTTSTGPPTYIEEPSDNLGLAAGHRRLLLLVAASLALLFSGGPR